MNKKELQNEINKTKECLANMEKMLEDCEYERYKPKINEQYYTFDSCGIISHSDWYNGSIDQKRNDFYNCFRTKEEAEVEVEKILVRRILKDIAKRLNKGEKIDWEISLQDKYFLTYDHHTNSIVQSFTGGYQYQGVVYCLDENFKDIVIQEIGEKRLKRYLKGE